MFQKIILFLILVCTSPVYAYGPGRGVFLYWGIFYTAVIFTLGLVFKYLCMLIMVRANTSALLIRALICTILMNILSTFVGAILRLPFSAGFLMVVNQPNGLINLSDNTTELIIVLGVLLIYIVINTIIEVWVPFYYFPQIPRGKVWFWTFVANSLSMSLLEILLLKGYFFKFTQSIFG